MPKVSHGATRSAAGKKKAKKRPEPRPMAEVATYGEAREPVQLPEKARSEAAEPAVRFRSRAREDGAVRPARAAAARAFQQVVDYSYVYTDLKIIGVLSVVLFGGLAGLTFVVR